MRHRLVDRDLNPFAMRAILSTLLLLLVLGLVTSVALAQACAAWRTVGAADAVARGVVGAGASSWQVTVHERAGIQQTIGVTAQRSAGGIGSLTNSTFVTAAPLPSPQPWPFSDRALQPLAQGIEIRTGWPWRCLRGSMLAEPGGAGWQVTERRWCIAHWRQQPALGPGIGTFRVLPLMPIWSALAMDTLFWMCAYGMVLMCARLARNSLATLTPRGMRRIAFGCVALGMLTTFLVSLGCALFVDENARDASSGDARGQSYRGPDYRIWWVARAHEAGATRWVSRWISGGDEIGSPSRPPAPSAEECVPSWAPFLLPRANTDLDEVEVIADARGWPWHAFGGGFEVQRIDAAWPPTYRVMRVHTGIVLSRSDLSGALDAYRTRLVPLRPLWPGFVLNAAFYTIAWATICIVALGPGTVRHALRRHRGQCLACGYDLRSIISDRCPECGRDRSDASP